MKIVSKDAPDIAIPSRKSAGLIRIWRRGDITSSSQEDHVKKLLRDLHGNKQWIVCDCRPELSLVDSPCLSVVERGGVLFLRNLPSREPHLESCKFKYVKSLPWLANQVNISSAGEDGVSGQEYTLQLPAQILKDLIIRAEWLSYDPEYSFLHLIERIQKEADLMLLGEVQLSAILSQSPKQVFGVDTPAKASLIIIHDIHWEKRLLIRYGRNDDIQTLEINGGIQPIRPTKLGTSVGGPYLALISTYSVGGVDVRACAYIPVSEKRNPVPVLSSVERSFAILFCGYAEWLCKSEGVSIALGKRLAEGGFIADGYQISSKLNTGDVEFQDGLIEPIVEDNRLSIPTHWFDADESVLKKRANTLKAVIRQKYLIDNNENVS